MNERMEIRKGSNTLIHRTKPAQLQIMHLTHFVQQLCYTKNVFRPAQAQLLHSNLSLLFVNLGLRLMEEASD